MQERRELNLSNFILLLIITLWAVLTVNYILPEAMGVVRYFLCAAVGLIAAVGAGAFIRSGDISEREEESRRKNRPVVRKDQGQTSAR